MRRLTTLLLAAALLTAAAAAPAQTRNGFDLAGALVPADEIHAGGPPRDGIPNWVDWRQRHPDTRVLSIAITPTISMRLT